MGNNPVTWNIDHERTKLLEIDELWVLAGDCDPVFTAIVKKQGNYTYKCSKCDIAMYRKDVRTRDLHDVIPEWVRGNRAKVYDKLQYIYDIYRCSECQTLYKPAVGFAAPRMRCTYRMEQYVGLRMLLSSVSEVMQYVDHTISAAGIEKIFSRWLKGFDKQVHAAMESPAVLGIFVLHTRAGQHFAALLNCYHGNLLDIVESGDCTVLKNRLAGLKKKNETSKIFIDPYSWILDAVRATYPNAEIYTDPSRVSETIRAEASTDIAGIVQKKTERNLFGDNPEDLSSRRKSRKEQLLKTNRKLKDVETLICAIEVAANGKGAFAKYQPKFSCTSTQLSQYWEDNSTAINACKIGVLPSEARKVIRRYRESLSYTNGCGLPALRARMLYTDAAENCFNDFFSIEGENRLNLRKMDGGIMYNALMSWELNKSSRYVPIDMIPYLIAAIEPAVDVLNSEGSMREMCSHPENRDRLLKKAYQFGFPQWVVERNLAAANRLIRQQRSNRRGDAIERSAWTEEDWQK